MSKELEELLELRVFPAAELALIRREVRSFKEHQDLVLARTAAAAADPEARKEDRSSSLGAGRLADGEDRGACGGYEDLIAILQGEKTMVDRKCAVLAERRQEEQEGRLAATKKAVRARIIEASQLKDKDSFTFRG